MTSTTTNASTALKTSLLPDKPLYGNAEQGYSGTGWQLSPEPFALTLAQIQTITDLGPALWRFSLALESLYRQSVKETSDVPAWVAGYLDQGKPEALLDFANMKRFKRVMPMVIRPDLLITEDGFSLTEIDSVPGGIGFTSFLNHLYAESGFDVVSPESISMADSFLAHMKALAPDLDNPTIAVIVSDEAKDYLPEWQWLETHLNERNNGSSNLIVMHPKDVDWKNDRLVYVSEQGNEQPIDIVYRFFELFDLPNIPKLELIQYAIKKGKVICSPPFKPRLEEKLALALFHHPALTAFWNKELSGSEYNLLASVIPVSWIMDPRPLPPHATIAGLTLGDVSVQSFHQLKEASQKERQLVIKPSGFSPLSWGSRGVVIGHDHPQEFWSDSVDAALKGFSETPSVLQSFEGGSSHTVQKLDMTNNTVSSMKARTRLCPYYFVRLDSDDPTREQADITLAGVLATSCPADKKIIHGMQDAVLAPVSVK